MKLPFDIIDLILPFIPTIKAIQILGCREQKTEHGRNVWATGIKFGTTVVLNWLKRVQEPIIAINIVISGNQQLDGSLECLDWALQHLQIVNWDIKSISTIIKNGDLEYIKWLIKNKFITFNTDCMDLCCHYGHLEILKHFYSNVKLSQWGYSKLNNKNLY